MLTEEQIENLRLLLQSNNSDDCWLGYQIMENNMHCFTKEKVREFIFMSNEPTIENLSEFKRQFPKLDELWTKWLMMYKR